MWLLLLLLRHVLRTSAIAWGWYRDNSCNLLRSLLEDRWMVRAKRGIELIRLAFQKQVFPLFDILDHWAIDRDGRQCVDSLHEVRDVGLSRIVLLKHFTLSRRLWLANKTLATKRRWLESGLHGEVSRNSELPLAVYASTTDCGKLQRVINSEHSMGRRETLTRV